METHLYSLKHKRELKDALSYFSQYDRPDDYSIEEMQELEKLSYQDFLKEFDARYGLLIKNYRELKMLRAITTIKNIIVFCFILSVIGALIWVFALID